MSNRPRNKTPNPVVADISIEEKVKAFAENPTSTQPTKAIVQVGDARVEQIKKSNGQGDRLAVRAANGKFTKMATAVAHADAKQAQQFLAEKIVNEAGVELSRKQHLRVALFDGATAAAKQPRALGNAVKAFEALNEDAALTQAKEALLADQSHLQDPVRVVVINCPENMMHKEIVDFEAELKRRKEKEAKGPSFIEGEVIQQNGPSGVLR
jgi:hypothetical protein